MQTGWQKINNEWYYFNSDGIRQVGWQKIGNYWYHFDSNGIRQTGWQQLNGNWYYFNSDGIRQVGWQQVDGKWYHLNSEGIMETGWVKIGTDWYFFHSTGERYVGWLPENGKTYHFNSNGIMDIGWKKINGYWYHFNSSGVMNTTTLTEGTRKYYFDNSAGVLYCTELIVNEEKQRKTNWCWAASAVMVGTYNTNSTRTQEDIVKEIMGSSDKNNTATDPQARDALNFASQNTKSGQIKNSFSYTDAVTQIDNNHPFMMHINWLEGGGHMVVCAGYKKENNIEYAQIVDPAANIKSKYFKCDDLNFIANFGYNIGTCVSIITY